MHQGDWSGRLPAALLRAAGHTSGRANKIDASSIYGDRAFALSIAISRQLGMPGSVIAREVGKRLGWPVFDRELLEQIANEMHVRVELLESVDERHQSWLLESIEALAPASVSEASYLRHLIETLFSLTVDGGVVIVGRGAAQILPQATTLRVRVVAPWDRRVASLASELNVPAHKAERLLADSDRRRKEFVQEHFQKDPTDATNYDLVLNSTTLGASACAALILQALDERRAAMTSTAAAVAKETAQA